MVMLKEPNSGKSALMEKYRSEMKGVQQHDSKETTMEDAFEAIWGPRCDEYEEGCPTCDAWRRFDTKSAEEQTIHVRIKHIYGTRMVYPECDKSKIFAQMAGHTVLTENTIDCIRRLGYIIEVIQEKVTL